jgi:signal peptidase I
VLIEQPAPPVTGQVPAPPSSGRRRLFAAFGPWVELAFVVVVALGLALGLQAYLVKPYRIPSESMEKTLLVGDRVLVVRFWYRFNEVARGDIVVFHPPGSGDTMVENGRKPANDLTYIKRVLGLPGEWIGGAHGHVWICRAAPRNPRSPGPGCTSLREPYVSSQQEDFPFQQVRVDHYFMMGDNRDISDDSRVIGQIPSGWVLGRAFVRYWPIDRVGWLG